jgi:hypothetical protein
MSTDDGYGSSHLTQWLLDTDSLEDFLQTLADAALELSRAQGAGLTLQRDGRPLTVVSAGTAAPKLDEKQYGQDDGPCLQALRTGEELRIDDMAEETRWDDYPAYAAACGIRSSLSLPIAAHTHTAAALNLYAGPPGAFEQADLTALRTLAAQATGAIALAQRITDTQEFAQQLQDAMRYRSIIDQALGVVMEPAPMHRRGSLRHPALRLPAPQHQTPRRVHRAHHHPHRPAPHRTRTAAPPLTSKPVLIRCRTAVDGPPHTTPSLDFDGAIARWIQCSPIEGVFFKGLDDVDHPSMRGWGRNTRPARRAGRVLEPFHRHPHERRFLHRYSG